MGFLMYLRHWNSVGEDTGWVLHDKNLPGACMIVDIQNFPNMMKHAKGFLMEYKEYFDASFEQQYNPEAEQMEKRIFHC